MKRKKICLSYQQKKLKTYDLIPYIFDEHGNPICENEQYTVRWVNSGYDYCGKYTGSRIGKSVFDLMSDENFEILMLRLKESNKKSNKKKKK